MKSIYCNSFLVSLTSHNFLLKNPTTYQKISCEVFEINYTNGQFEVNYF